MDRINTAAVALTLVLVAGVASPLMAEDTGSDLTLGMVALNVPDLAQAEKYYTEVFGFRRTGIYPPGAENPIEIFLALPGTTGASLALAKFNDDPLPEGKGRYGRLILTTSQAAAVAKRAEAAGSEIRHVQIPGDNPPVIIFFHDLNGYEIELYQAAE